MLERLIPWLGRSAAAGAAAGLMMGGGFRVAMRIAAVVEGRDPSFTVGGTAFLLVAGAGFGVVFGVGYGALRRWLPGGLGYGLALVTLFGLLLFGDPQGEARTIGDWRVNAVTFGGTLLLTGPVIARGWRLVERHARLAVRVGSGVVAGALTGGAAAVVLTLVGLSRWAASPPHGPGAWAGRAAGLALLGVVVGALAGVVYGVFGGRSRRRWSRMSYPAAMIGLWLVMALTVGDEGPTGSDRALEILSVVGLILGGFAVGTASLADRVAATLSSSQPELIPDRASPALVSSAGLLPQETTPEPGGAQSHQMSWSTTPWPMRFF